LPFSLLACLIVLPATAQTPLVEIGDEIPGVGTVTEVSAMAINDSGEWVARVTTDNPDPARDEAIVGDVGLVIREGMTMRDPAGASLQELGSVTLSRDGRSAWELAFRVPGDNTEVGVYLKENLVLREGSFTGAPEFSPNSPYTSLLEAKINDHGDILLVAEVLDLAITELGSESVLVLDLDAQGDLQGERLVVRVGQVLPGLEVDVEKVFDDPKKTAFNNLGDVLYCVTVDGHTANMVVYLNDTLVAREQSPCPVPNRNWTNFVDAGVDLNDNRDFVIRGKIGGAHHQDILLCRNDTKLAQEGDFLADIAPAYLSWIGRSARIANSGDVLWFGQFEPADPGMDTGLFVNHSLIMQEGVSTIGGVPVSFLYQGAQGFEISPNGRYVAFRANLANGLGGLYMLDRGEVAYQELRNGTGVNELCLSAGEPPVIGASWLAQIDSTNHAGAAVAVLFAHSEPHPGVLTSHGELLLDIGSPRIMLQGVPATGLDTFSVSIPSDPAFIGATGHIQGAIFGGGSIELCNAIHPVAGL